MRLSVILLSLATLFASCNASDVDNGDDRSWIPVPNKQSYKHFQQPGVTFPEVVPTIPDKSMACYDVVKKYIKDEHLKPTTNIAFGRVLRCTETPKNKELAGMHIKKITATYLDKKLVRAEILMPINISDRPSKKEYIRRGKRLYDKFMELNEFISRETTGEDIAVASLIPERRGPITKLRATWKFTRSEYMNLIAIQRSRVIIAVMMEVNTAGAERVQNMLKKIKIQSKPIGW